MLESNQMLSKIPLSGFLNYLRLREFHVSPQSYQLIVEMVENILPDYDPGYGDEEFLSIR